VDPQIVALRDGRTAQLRPAGPEDRDAVQQFVRGLSPLARRRRFFAPVAELSPDQLDRMTRVRNPREFVLVAEDATAPRIVALAQYAFDDEREAEFAVVVADDWQRVGLARQLLDALAARAAAFGIAVLNGIVLAENWPMLGLAAAAGFDLADDREPQFVHARKVLAPPRSGGVSGRLAGAWQDATRAFEVEHARWPDRIRP